MRAMKDSGIAWIGEIPADWTKTRIGNLFRFSSGDSLTNEEIQDEGLYKVYGANGPRGYYHHSNLAGKHILIGRVGALCGNVHVVNEAVWATEHALIAEQISSNIYTDFAARVFESMNLGQYSKASAQPVIASSVVQRLQIPIPPFSEQHRIADYLDRKCSQIDAIIARQQEVIEKLKAYKLSVITEAVTKGLNPHAPMKDSGVEWIGEIPEQWTKVRLKNICQFINGDRSSNYPSPNEYVDEGIPFVGADSLYGRYVDIIQSKKITKEKYHSMGGAKIQKGDILYTLRGSTIGKNALSTFDEGTVASSLMVIRPTSLLSNFLLYWLNSEEEFQQRQSYINGSTAPNLSAENVGSFIMFLPSKVEQQEIADYLDKKCAEIESTILKKQMLVEWLGKYKKSLIYEVVTGKKEV